MSHLKIGDIRVEKLYLKWDNKLQLKASLIDLSELKSDNEPLDLTPLKEFPTYIEWIQEWTDTIEVDIIRYEDITASLYYKEGKSGRLSVQRGPIALGGDFILTPQRLQANLSTFKSGDIYADGNITVDIPQQHFSITSTLTLPDTPTLRVLATGDTQKLSLFVRADTPFKRIDKLTDILGVNPDIRPWILKHLVFKEATLQQCEAHLSYNEDPLRKIIIRARVHDVSYAFAQGIEPIKAPEVALSFQNGKLTILPFNSTFSSIPLENSTLNLDFTAPDPLLNIHILAQHAQLNDPIVNLLKIYGISLPLRQEKGTTNVDLALSLNLSSFKIRTKGVFIPTASTFILDTFTLQSKGGKVTLEDSKVNFFGFQATHTGYGTAKVSGIYNGASSSGEIRIHPLNLVPQKKISLLPLPTTLLTVHVSPKKNILEISPTHWKAFDEIIQLDGFKTPINFTKTSLTLPAVKFLIPQKASGTLKGKVDTSLLDIDLVINKLNLFETELKNKSLPLSIRSKGDDIILGCTSPSTWKIRNQKVILSPFTLRTQNTNILIHDMHASIDTLFSTQINGNYNLETDKGILRLDKIAISDPKISKYFSFKTPQSMAIDFSQPTPRFALNKLGTTVEMTTLGWKINIDNLSYLSPSVPLLRQNNLTNGTMALFYDSNSKITTFTGNINYPYKLIITQNGMVSKYTFTGSYDTNNIARIRINNRLDVTYDDELIVKAENTGFNLPEVLRWIHDHPKTPNKSSLDDDTGITLKGSNSFIYLSDNRKILSDSFMLALSGDDGYASLKHSNGVANMTMKNGLFYIEGKNFNAQFMENIFAYSDFIGGRFSFTLKGQNDIYEGLMRVEKVTLKQFKLLTNILAFTDTLSTLASFSLPNYNQKGLFVNDAYTHFTYQNNVFDMDTLSINSPELQMSGNAKGNTINGNISGVMTLKTNMGSSIGKIPLVGYLLLGKDGSISTTVNISGKANDPVIETGVAKEIAVAPFNILKRTVTYPLGWMDSKETK